MRGLVKHYGETKALDGVDLDVREGTVLGVLGPNGAGKTTLVRVLSTLRQPGRRAARPSPGTTCCAQPRQLRRVIGLTGQYASVDEKLSGWENLYMIGRLLDLSRKDARARADELLERFSLTEAAKRPGDARTPAVCAAGSTWPPSMIGQPAVLYLDEPTTGLDPRTRNEVWDGGQADGRGRARPSCSPPSTWRRPSSSPHELTVIDRGKVIADGADRRS